MRRKILAKKYYVVNLFGADVDDNAVFIHFFSININMRSMSWISYLIFTWDSLDLRFPNWNSRVNDGHSASALALVSYFLAQR